MADEFTVCAQGQEANVIAILTSATFGHAFVETFGPFDNLNAYPVGGSVGRIATAAGGGRKMIVHTTSP